MRSLLAALFLVASLGLTACTDDGEPSGSPSPTESESVEESPSETPVSELPPAADACEVLDPADVGRVLGIAVEPVVADQGCRFASPDDPSGTSLGHQPGRAGGDRRDRRGQGRHQRGRRGRGRGPARGG